MEHRQPGASSKSNEGNGSEETSAVDLAHAMDPGNGGAHDTSSGGGGIGSSGKATRNLRLLAALAHCIKTRRLSLRITQDELAHVTGLDRSYIVSIEKGKRNISITKLVQIASELGLTASQLLRMAEEQAEDS